MTATSARTVSMSINGETIVTSVPDRKLLCDFLRENLLLTGTHVGCEQGVCGCCTVLVDGQPTRSCLMLAVQAEGRTVTTIEGVAAKDGSLHAVQRAFHEQHALQCGFCTPGFIMSAIAFLRERDPTIGSITEDEVREHLAGTICRCTGYTNIVRAVCQAANELRGS